MSDPVSTYLAISEKIYSGEDDTYPPLEMAHDMAALLLSCRTLIQQNGTLSARLVAAEQKNDDHLVTILEKDIEIHELKEKQH